MGVLMFSLAVWFIAGLITFSYTGSETISWLVALASFGLAAVVASKAT